LLDTGSDKGALLDPLIGLGLELLTLFHLHALFEVLELLKVLAAHPDVEIFYLLDFL
jgi:hypothetical protein